MVTAAELINRRIGRMEALIYDLSQVKPGYQPTELEMLQALNLSKALDKFLEQPPGATQAPDPDPGTKPAPAAAGKKAPK